MGRRRPEGRRAMSDRSRLDRRRLVIGALCFLWFACIIARLYYFQVIQYGDLLGRAQRQQQRTIEVAPQRGGIYDRQMNPLAMSMGVDSVFAVPSELSEPKMVASLLARVLRLDGEDLGGRFQAMHSFCWVKRKVTTEEALRVRDLNLKGVYFERETKRFYPKGELAAQVVGYVGLDDTGLGGLEFALDQEIKGKPGRVLLASDARRRIFHSTDWPGTPGKSIVLTLDEKIQYIAEKALAEAVDNAHAAGGVAIVQNSNTGEILALANQPTFNPNEFGISSAAARLDRAVGWVYEPGSTFKLVTISAAIEENLTNPQEVIDCQNGSIVLAGHTIHDHKHFGDLSVTDVMAKSSDVGAIKLGLRLGEDRFYRYVRGFGLGTKTDIELPGEERGLLKPPSRWSGLTIGEMSMGQEVGVTPLQMVTAFSAVANGGILFQPRIVHDVYLSAHHDALPPATGRRVISEHTAELMRQILGAVVDHGTGVPARLAGYTSAGKTGTAQKIDENGRYSKSRYVASFIGFAPATRPAVTILVVVDAPVGAHHGTEVAAPVFRSIAEQTLGYLSVPQDNPSRWPQSFTPAPEQAPSHKRGDFAGLLPSDLGLAGVTTSPVRKASYLQGRSSASTDADSTPRIGGVTSSVVLGDGPLVAVPDFSGWAARHVAEVCEKLHLDLTVTGTGLVVEQNPVGGTTVPSGAGVSVRMAR
jgi:cell division protein FtsI (penicillin-binding protein 3)